MNIPAPIIAAIVSGTGSIIVLLLGLVLKGKVNDNSRVINEIHVLVNSKMDAALQKIGDLEGVILGLRKELADAKEVKL